MNASLRASFVSVLAVATCSSLLVTLTSCSLCDWKFVQSVGGIAVGTPARDNRGHVWLPIHCDVSGTQKITVRPTNVSGMTVCEAPVVRVRSNTIFLTIRIAYTNPWNSHAVCGPADLGRLPAGTYSVVYLGPDRSQHPIGVIQVP